MKRWMFFSITLTRALVPLVFLGSTATVAVAAPTFHGGPVMSGTVNVYYIFYGSWPSADARQILIDFANSVGGSSFWDINTLYTGPEILMPITISPHPAPPHVWNSVHFGGYTFAAGK